MADQWKIDAAKAKIAELQKEEARQFAIAYAELGDEYAGYLQTLPQQTKIFHEEFDEETIKALKKEYGWDKISAWNKATFYTTHNPYLGIDGYLTMLHDKYDKLKVPVSINIELIETKDKLIVKAIVNAHNHKHTEAMVDVPYKMMYDIANKVKKPILDADGKPVFDNIEIPMSMAVRKALAYLGMGRFATHKTEYSEHPMIAAFKQFYADKQKEKDEQDTDSDGTE